MSKFRCFDVASVVTDEATKRFAPLYREDKIKTQQLRHCCDGIDALAERFHEESFAVEVDDITKDITITLVCGELFFESPDDAFYNLLRKTKTVSFRKDDEDVIRIDFVFDGIWIKTNYFF